MREQGPFGGTTAGGGTIEPTVLIPKHVLALETALRLLHATLGTLAEAPASEAELEPTAQALGKAIVSACAGFDGASDPLSGVRDAVVALDEAKNGLVAAAGVDPPLQKLVSWLDNARGWLLVAEERHTRVIPNVVETSPLYASSEEPRLHNIPRTPLWPRMTVAEAKPPPPPKPPVERKKPTTITELDAHVAEMKLASERARIRRARELKVRLKIEELKKRKPIIDEPPPGFSRPRTYRTTPKRFIEARCRECFEEISMLGVQRAPLLGDPWRSASFMERRILASIDAIAALGPIALDHLEPLVLDAPAKDPSRGFGIAMVAGCFVGRDALGAVERALRHLGPQDPEVARCVGGGLKLIPHPDLPNMLRAWSSDSNPGLRAIAIDVLMYRGLATPEEIVRAASDTAPMVSAIGLIAAGLARVGELDELVTKTIEDADPGVRNATYWAMILGNSTHAADRVEGELKGELEDQALLPLALGASQRHAETIAERLEMGLTKARVIAAGWVGTPRVFPALLAGLDCGNPEMALACALSLDRITNANLIDRVHVPPEKIDVPDDVGAPDIGDPAEPSLERKVSDPRDRPSDGSPDRMMLPTLQRARWEAYFAAEPSRYLEKLRYRRGLPYSPNISLVEIDRYPLLEQERRNLQRELIIRTGERVHFDPHDFVAVQERSIPEWGPHANRASSIPGSWSRPPRARH